MENKENIVMFPFMAQGRIIPFLALALEIRKEAAPSPLLTHLSTSKNSDPLFLQTPPFVLLKSHSTAQTMASLPTLRTPMLFLTLSSFASLRLPCLSNSLSENSFLNLLLSKMATSHSA